MYFFFEALDKSLPTSHFLTLESLTFITVSQGKNPFIYEKVNRNSLNPKKVPFFPARRGDAKTLHAFYTVFSYI